MFFSVIRSTQLAKANSFQPGQVIFLAQQQGVNWMNVLYKERAGDYVKLLCECDL